MSFRRGPHRRQTKVKLSPVSSQDSDEIVAKGRNSSSSSNTISFDGIQRVLSGLRPYANTRIRDLPKKAQELHRQAVAYVSLMHDGDYYPAFSDAVQQKFGDVHDVEPGTVGAYFMGCLVENVPEGIPPSCTPTCIGSAPPDQTRDSNWSPCERPVVLGTKVNDKDHCSILNNITGRGDAIIYIDTTTFDGFTEEEKKFLRDSGVDTVIIIGSDQTRPLLRETPLAAVPVRTIGGSNANRNGTRTANGAVLPAAGLVAAASTGSVGSTLANGQLTGLTNANTNGISSTTIWIIIGVIILVLILIFFLWNKQGSTNTAVVIPPVSHC